MGKFTQYILPKSERYSILHLNEIKVISHGQTLAMVLGSCVSTIFIAKHNTDFYLAANHIVIANPKIASGPMLSAENQINIILELFQQNFDIKPAELLCFHLIGGGAKNFNHKFAVHLDNQQITQTILTEKKYTLFFQDVGSYYTANYSIYKNNLATFVENKFIKRHFSFILDLNLLFEQNLENYRLPASVIKPGDPGFEQLVTNKVITSITGERNR